MLTPQLHQDTAPISRLSFLAYLCSASNSIHSTTPIAYSEFFTSTSTTKNTFPHIPKDEEAGLPNYYLENEYGDVEEEEHCCWGFADGLTLAAYIGMIIILVLNLDFFLSRWDIGTGIFHLKNTNIPNIGGTSLHFCQIYQGSGQSMWRLLSDSNTKCLGESITLFSGEGEALMLESSGVIFEVEMESGKGEEEAEKDTESKSLGWEKVDEAVVKNLGDDLAQEGKLSMPPPPSQQGNWMHAGFGGPWRRV